VDGEQKEPALVMVWSSIEPGRVGEVALVSGEGVDVALGDLKFYRQRPGLMEEQPPLHPDIPRDAIVFRRKGAELRARRGIARAKPIRMGETIAIGEQLLIYVTERPATMPPHALTPLEMPFGEADANRIMGESPAAWRLRSSIAFAAGTDRHVLITGESGTGKEAVADAIHKRSSRANGPFVPQNAAAIPVGLIEVELFGNAKNYPNPGMPEGIGLVGKAERGVLFLDEIGELPFELHARLLRITDPYGDYQRLGDPTRRFPKLRFIGATNRGASALKEDLRARLKTHVAVPSFSERREDIPFLIRKIVLREAAQSPKLIGRYVHEVNGRKEARISRELVDYLMRMPIKTNFRQIDGVLGEAMEQSTGDVLTLPRTRSLTADDSFEPTEKEPPTAADIQRALAASENKVAPAARALGISRQALYRLMDAFGIPRQS
jgi:two-component system nitrogen regulation response regulator GlnG/two-component system response regulator HydG